MIKALICYHKAMSVEAPAMEQPMPEQPVEQATDADGTANTRRQPEMMQEGGTPKAARVEVDKAAPAKIKKLYRQGL